LAATASAAAEDPWAGRLPVRTDLPA